MAVRMTSDEFIKRLKEVASEYKTLYVLGCFGSPLTDKNKTRYTTNNSYNGKPARSSKIIAASAETFGFDCSGLIKGTLWGWNGNKSKTYGGASYASNNVPDYNADTLIKKCGDVSTDFSNIIPGEAVWIEGHIGVYIGDGLAIECTPRWSDGVQITACNCSKSGYNRRNWAKHGKLPYVDYEPTEVKPEASEPTTDYKVGDIVIFKGTTHYTNPNATKPKSCKCGKAKVTKVYRGKHPYHLVRTVDGCSTVYGWVDEDDIEGVFVPDEEWTPKVGDIVTYNGNVHYTNPNAKTPKSCKGGKAKITQVYQLGKAKHPFHILRVSGSGSTVYGWVDADSFTKG